MKANQAKELIKGHIVEIRYIGRNQGLVLHGIVKNVYVDGSAIDIDLIRGGHGIKFGVPCTIVHRMVQKNIIVSYDAHDNVIERLERRGAIVGQSHCVIVGRLAKVFYSVPSK